MGTGTIQVWVTNQGDPCGVSDRPPDNDSAQWVVGVWECSGKLLSWCETEFFDLKTKCGFVEIQVPPGCYVVVAADSMWVEADGIHSNHMTDRGIVRVDCDERVCVTLYAPSAHMCGVGFIRTVETLAERGVIDADLAQPALQAMRDIVAQLRPGPFERRAEGAMLKLVEAAGGQRPKRGK